VPDGTPGHVRVDGASVHAPPDGTRAHVRVDGTATPTRPDGTSAHALPGGTPEHARDDGTSAHVPPEGVRAHVRVVLDGAGLDVGGVVRLADHAAVPDVPAEALARVRRAWQAAERLAARGRLYGRGTGVGAHRQIAVDEVDLAGHGLRLLRSHAGGAGAVLPARQARAMLAVRANQLLAGGSGIHPGFVEALAEALRLGVHPAISEYGAVGTGDLTALAQTGLTLLGERPWLGAPHEAPAPGGTESPRAAPGPQGTPGPSTVRETPEPGTGSPRGADRPGAGFPRGVNPYEDGSPIPVPRRSRPGPATPGAQTVPGPLTASQPQVTPQPQATEVAPRLVSAPEAA
jgi:histidine ammonia-lyase